jgi:SAM-dependent methyltransferase
MRSDIPHLLLKIRGRIALLRRHDPELTRLMDDVPHGRTLEIGGPSPIFAPGGLMPLYSDIREIHSCNFSEITLWPGSYPERTRVSQVFVAEATALSDADDDSYDAVLASHVVEHLADPITALREWRRVLRPEGRLLVVVPHFEGTFDHRRPVTTMEHLRADTDAKTPESDLGHVEEVLSLHDHGRTPRGDDDNFEDRCRDNASQRSLHHHVFDTRLVVSVLARSGFDVLHVVPRPPHHIIALATPAHGASAEIQVELKEVLASSPFRGEREASS